MQDTLLNGRSSVLGAMCWMFVLSTLLTLALWWVPFVGVFIGPIVGGYIGGRRAGTVGKAFLAAILPSLLTLVVCSGLGGVLGLATQHGAAGGFLGLLLGGLGGIVLLAHNAALIVAALVGGATRQAEPY